MAGSYFWTISETLQTYQSKPAIPRVEIDPDEMIR